MSTPALEIAALALLSLAVITSTVQTVRTNIVFRRSLERMTDALPLRAAREGKFQILVTPAQWDTINSVLTRHTYWTMEQADELFECPTWIVVARTDEVSER